MRLLPVVLLLCLVACGCSKSPTRPWTSDGLQRLRVEDLLLGTGETAMPGDRLTVHYEGRFLDGTIFDRSRDRGEPFTFVLGIHEVIEGWDRGLVGMRESGRRRLVIPSALAYGEQGIPGIIPPDATLEFEVELLTVMHPILLDATSP